MFNYDLPWNPMAVEQRIGRLHRYGQHETVQVYNLVAEDTVEERIYFLLEEKLREIAQTIGKVDDRGDVVEDFRSEILGFLGSSPNYQELYKRALVNRDYRRTELEIAEALERAKEASEGLRALTQDLDSFDLEHYRHLQGQFSLEDLRTFTEKAIVRLGGAVVPLGDETYRIETPPAIREQSRGVLMRYEAATFNRDVAMRRKRIEFMGLGHPLVDALIAYFKSPIWRGEVTRLSSGDEPLLSVRWLVSVQSENGKTQQHFHHVVLNQVGSARKIDERHDLNLLPILANMQQGIIIDTAKLQAFAEAEFQGVLAELRAVSDGQPTIRGELVGLACC